MTDPQLKARILQAGWQGGSVSGGMLAAAREALVIVNELLAPFQLTIAAVDTVLAHLTEQEQTDGPNPILDPGDVVPAQPVGVAQGAVRGQG